MRTGKWLALVIGGLLFLGLWGGFLVDSINLNLANIQTMKAGSVQPGTSLTDWGECRQAHVIGRNLLLQGKYNESLPLLREGAACADDPWAWFDLGQAQYQLGDLPGAAESWQHTQEGYNEAVRLAQMAAQTGNETAALAGWQFAVQVNPAEQAPYIQMARLAAASTPEQVEPLLKQALTANPNAPEAYIELGSYYQKTGERQEAQRQFEQALALDPTNISLLVTMAGNSAELGDISAAINYWQEVALRSDRRRGTAYYQIGELALNDKNFSSALAFYLRAVDLEPDNAQFLLGLARGYFESGCKQKAIDAYQNILAVFDKAEVLAEAQSKLADLAVMTTETIPCPDGL